MGLCSSYLFADLSWGESLLETRHGGAQMLLGLGMVALGGLGMQIDPGSLPWSHCFSGWQL